MPQHEQTPTNFSALMTGVELPGIRVECGILKPFRETQGTFTMVGR